MNFSLKAILFFLVISTACGQSEKPAALSFPKSSGRVNDFGGIYSPSEEITIDSLIKSFESRSDVEIKVVSLDSTMTTVEGFNSYILRLARYWELGKKSGKDNGVLIGISPAFQRVRITNGLGLEMVLTDVEIKMILDDSMFPLFRKGEYFNGTKVGLTELTRLLEK
ncbi:MAG: TPM domain-containing protein [Sphingobacteriaceae bacterium]|nr:TPM domain-containing protein [Sphingobacteriaceae bacterium]